MQPSLADCSVDNSISNQLSVSFLVSERFPVDWNAVWCVVIFCRHVQWWLMNTFGLNNVKSSPVRFDLHTTRTGHYSNSNPDSIFTEWIFSIWKLVAIPVQGRCCAGKEVSQILNPMTTPGMKLVTFKSAIRELTPHTLTQGESTD